MRGASCAEALGLAWGQYADQFAEYRFALARPIPDARLCLRYALGLQEPSRLRLTLDGLPLGEPVLAPTGGWGHRPSEWRMTTLKTNSFPAGRHTLRMVPAADHQVVCIDLFYLSEGELQLRTDFPSAAARVGREAKN